MLARCRSLRRWPARSLRGDQGGEFLFRHAFDEQRNEISYPVSGEVSVCGFHRPGYVLFRHRGKFRDQTCTRLSDQAVFLVVRHLSMMRPDHQQVHRRKLADPSDKRADPLVTNWVPADLPAVRRKRDQSRAAHAMHHDRPSTPASRCSGAIRAARMHSVSS